MSEMIQVLRMVVMMAVMSGLMIILSAAVTGYLVFRAKRDSKDALFPEKFVKAKPGPIVVDEIAREYDRNPMQDEDNEGLPDAIKKMNEKFRANQAVAALKERKRDA